MNPSKKSTALSADLNNFIYGVSRRNFQNAPELTKIGISLLKNFPAARDAVLEYFAMVFHDAVNVSINQSDYEHDTTSTYSLDSVSMIGPELCNLGTAWAPYIAPWCIKLLTDIATEKANLPNVTLQNSEPVRVLLDITTQNLTLLDPEERAKCIDMMIASRVCSWAVGWVGRLEPALVAPRALARGVEAARAVLTHLGNHPPALIHVRAALLDLFTEAIREDSPPDKKRDVIPYLLTLASKSDIVLKALTQDIDETLTDEVIDRLTMLCRSQRHTPAWEALGPDTLVTLLQRADIHCFLLLLRQAMKNVFCRQLTEYLLQKLEIEALSPDKQIPLLQSASEEIALVHEKLLTGNQLEQYSLARILILVSYQLPSDFVSTISYLLVYSRNDTTLALLLRIISGTLNMHTPNDSTDMSNDTERYQEFINTAFNYALRDAMMADTQIKKIFVEGKVPSDQKTYLHHFCLNVIKILRWQKAHGMTVASLAAGSRVARAAALSLETVADTLHERLSLLPVSAKPCSMHTLPEMPTCHALAQVIDRIDMSGTELPPPSVEVIIKIIQATCKYFFRCLHEKDTLSRYVGCARAGRLIRALCAQCKLSRAVALRDLLEGGCLREPATFGSRDPPVPVRTQGMYPLHRQEEMLMHLNQKHGPITQLTQSHTSVFHAGVIGKGVRRHEPPEQPISIKQLLTPNNELLMGAIMSCMDGNSGLVEGATAVSLLLVELISPDVMYNGLPWPDEDFTKQVSIERELYMRRAVEGCVTARAALRRCAALRPALCLASALLRAAAAAALHRLRAGDDRYTQSAEMAQERAALTELLATMTLGQLLPRPLCYMHELVPHLTAQELVQMLRDCLWNYTRDHVPSPALFECDASGLHWRDPSTCKPPSNYTDTLRIIIQKRIAKLGHLYPVMFLNLEKTESNLVYGKSK